MQSKNRTSNSIEAVLASAAALLDDAGIDEPRREAGLLLCTLLARPRAFLIAHPDYGLPSGTVGEYLRIIRRRASREPFHYITGTKEFFGLEFYVGTGVLIPRPETEALVEQGIRGLSARDSARFLEIGIGSGCVSVSILHALQNVSALGVDISPDALAIADRNSRRHNVNHRLELRTGNLYQGIEDRFDLIISNPPYIPSGELAMLQPEVRLYEPHIALFAGTDGLGVIRELIEGAAKLLTPSGLLILEIGAGQSAEVRKMLQKGNWSAVDFLNDLQGIPRVVRAVLAE